MCVLCQHHTVFRIVYYILHCHSDFGQLRLKYFFQRSIVFRMFPFCKNLPFVVNMNEQFSSKLSRGPCFDTFICSDQSAWCCPFDWMIILLWLGIWYYCPTYLVLLACVSLLHNSCCWCEYFHNSCSRSEGEMVWELTNGSYWDLGYMDGW